MLIVQYIGFILQTSGGFCLDLLILMNYLRFSNRIVDTEFSEKAYNVLTDSMKDKSSPTSNETEQIERIRAHRRHEVYREMAD